ncbi:MAG TPA: TRAP transporter small permease [Burkholderiales bacterium]|nr:TRAP transporter small permease [Burkholderiales bacterium]
MLRARRVGERIATWMNRVAGWVYIAASVFITFDVLARQFLGFSSKSTVEMTGYMLAVGISWGLAYALVERIHVRIDVLINRLPLELRQYLHGISLLLLTVFAGFLAWASIMLVRESIEFHATDLSPLSVPLAAPQGLWALGLCVFFGLCLVTLVEVGLLLVKGDAAAVDRMLGQRTFEEETEETLEAVASVRGSRE